MPTKDEELMHLLKHLEAHSRRGKRGCGCTPPSSGEQVQAPAPSTELGHGVHGRGRLLSRLRDNGPMSQSQLATLLEIRPQSLSELISKLESEGLISRTQSEEDKRQTIVSLTDAGEEKIAVISEARRRHAEEFFAPLDEQEKEILSAILQKLTEAQKNNENNKNTEE